MESKKEGIPLDTKNTKRLNISELKEFPFYMDKPLITKLDLFVERLKKSDVWLIIDGDEGAGKTNMAAYIMLYVAIKTGRELGIDNFYFSAKDMFEVAKDNKEMILNWDEAALGGLSREWQNKNQINLMKFGMTGRIKHHFVVLCIPKFDKLGEYFVRDRSLGLIHVYERRGIERGRYLYYSKRSKEKLWEECKRNRKRKYKKLSTFHGTFALTVPKIMDEEKYDQKKIDAIKEIGVGTEKISKKELKTNEMKYNLYQYAKKKKSTNELSRALNVSPKTFYNWKDIKREQLTAV